MTSVETVALLGYGRFGRALGELLLEAGIDFVAHDPFAEVPAAHRATSLDELTSRAEIVIVAVPVPHIRRSLEALLPHLRPSHVVLDVGSVKLRPYEALDAVLGEHIPWVATHPLFGPVSLALAERPLRVVVCPSPRHAKAAARVKALYASIGCDVIEQTAENHDRIMAHTHALTFFVAKGMMDAGAGLDVAFAPPSFQAISRTIETVRSDAGHLFAAIQTENPFAAEARHALLEALGAIEHTLETSGVPEAAGSIPDLGTKSPELKETREHIDEIDRELLSLLARRTQLSRRAAKAKAALGHPVLDPARESELLAARRAWGEEMGVSTEAVEEVFRAILRGSRRAQS